MDQKKLIKRLTKLEKEKTNTRTQILDALSRIVALFVSTFIMMLIWDYVIADLVGLPEVKYWTMFFIKIFMNLLISNKRSSK